MHVPRSAIVIAVGACGLFAAAAAASSQRAIPVRTVDVVSRTDSGVLSNIWVVQPRSDGSVLVNDAVRRRLLLFDASLKRFTLIADTAREAPVAFGAGIGGLLPFVGDSAAFIDAGSRTLVVVDSAGTMGRTMAAPNVNDVLYFLGLTYGTPGFDTHHRLYYRGGTIFPPRNTTPATRPETTYVVADSAPVLRADFSARRVDTVAKIRVPLTKTRVVRTPTGATSRSFVNPLPVTDGWAYYPDGTIAIIRGHDYHVDWVMPDGTRKSGPRMPFDWRRVTDADKKRIADSALRVADSVAGAATERARAAAEARGERPAAAAPVPSEVLGPEDLPDYFPPIRPSSPARVDPEGNLWILPATTAHAGDGLLFDLVNRDGEVVERVRLPAGRNLIGFGAKGELYLSVAPPEGWTRVERARVVRR